MKKLTLYLIFTVGVITVFSACKKNPVPVSNNVGTQLIGIRQDASVNWTFTYNSAGLVETYNNNNGGSITIRNTTYGTDKRPISALGNDNFFYKFTNIFFKFIYIGNQLDRVEVYQEKDFINLLSYTKYFYLNNKVIQTDFYIKLSNGILTYYTKKTFEYNSDGDVNIVKVYYSNDSGIIPQLVETDTYDYDENINPMFGIYDYTATLTGFPPAHNVVKILSYNPNNVLIGTTTYSYKYNHLGFPTECKRNFSFPGFSDDRTLTFTYR